MDPQVRFNLTLFGGVLPGVVALLTLFIAWGYHAHRSNMRELESADAKVSDGPRWLLPVLLTGGLIACDLVINTGAQLWPTSATERYIHVFVLLGLLGFTEGLIRWPASFVLVARAMVYAGIVWMLAGGYVDGEILTKPDLIAWMALAGIGGSAIAHHTDTSLENTPAWSAGAVGFLMIGGLMPIMFTLGWAVGSMMLIGAVAVLVNVCIVGVLFKRVRVSRGGVSVIVGVMIALMIGSGIQSEPKSVPAIVMLALLPLAASIPGKTVLRSLVVRLACLAVLLGTIGGMVAWQGSIDKANAEPDPSADLDE